MVISSPPYCLYQQPIKRILAVGRMSTIDYAMHNTPLCHGWDCNEQRYNNKYPPETYHLVRKEPADCREILENTTIATTICEGLEDKIGRWFTIKPFLMFFQLPECFLRGAMIWTLSNVNCIVNDTVKDVLCSVVGVSCAVLLQYMQ
jgi:hypothetical protein